MILFWFLWSSRDNISPVSGSYLGADVKRGGIIIPAYVKIMMMGTSGSAQTGIAKEGQ